MLRLDHDLLRTFVAVADARNISRAGERLRLSQPTVSLQLKRLEQALGCALVERSPRSFRLTAAGETLLAYGRRILALSEEALAQIAETRLEGVVRLGTPEDFATTHLAGVLSAFTRGHPNVALEVTTDLTRHLVDRFHAGEFDLVLIKRERLGPSEGVQVWREPLVWTASAETARHFSDSDEAVPLVVSPAPCVYRDRAQRALDAAGRRWRVVYTSTSLAGAQAAVRAGLGVTVLPAGMVPPDFAVFDRRAGLPVLDDAEIALIGAPVLSAAAERLSGHIVGSLEEAR